MVITTINLGGCQIIYYNELMTTGGHTGWSITLQGGGVSPHATMEAPHLHIISKGDGWVLQVKQNSKKPERLTRKQRTGLS